LLSAKFLIQKKKEHWQEVIAEANALSLFADKCFLDIRTTTGKLDHALLLEYLERPSGDSFLLIRTDKADSSTQKNAVV
jgi:DNA polymerase III delta subunit